MIALLEFGDDDAPSLPTGHSIQYIYVVTSRLSAARAR